MSSILKIKKEIEELNSKIDFKKLNSDLELGKHTIRIIGCGLCNYDCKNCSNPFK